MLTIQVPSANAAVVKSGNANGIGRVLRIGPLPENKIPETRIATLGIFTLAFAGMFGIFGMFGAELTKVGVARRATFARTLGTCAVLAATLVIASCAGTATEKQPPAQSKTYTVTVTATAANTPAQMQSFTLTVTP
jgi:hypothetical protein